jgi:hypothetical protein
LDPKGFCATATAAGPPDVLLKSIGREVSVPTSQTPAKNGLGLLPKKTFGIRPKFL